MARKAPVANSARAGRLAALALALVLASLGVFALLSTRRTTAVGDRVRELGHLADVYQQARFAVGSEESMERKYRLEPGPDVLVAFREAEHDLTEALKTIAATGPARDRTLARDLLARQTEYDDAIRRLFEAVDARDTQRVLAIDSGSVDPVFGAIESQVDGAARRARRQSLLEIERLRRTNHAVLIATPVAFSIGMMLLAFFALILVRSQRAEARKQAEIVVLEDATRTDGLTGLRNRRALMTDLESGLAVATANQPSVLAIFDLDGFKTYNDTFGHPAGDTLLTRLAESFAASASASVPGTAYRMGGDEFCLLAHASLTEIQPLVEAARTALTEEGDGFSIGCSAGWVVLPTEASNATEAIRIADQRMYVSKQRGRPSLSKLTSQVLVRALYERTPDLSDHVNVVAKNARAIAASFDLSEPEIEQIVIAAELHDVGKLAIPLNILNKPDPLDDREWELIRQHTVIGERIISAAVALQPVGQLVRCSHESFDGTGYPDGLAGAEIPLGARIIAVSDAYDAMLRDRPYRAARTQAAVIAELRRCSGTQFDPAVVTLFLEWLANTQDDAPSEVVFSAANRA